MMAAAAVVVVVTMVAEEVAVAAAAIATKRNWSVCRWQQHGALDGSWAADNKQHAASDAGRRYAIARTDLRR